MTFIVLIAIGKRILINSVYKHPGDPFLTSTQIQFIFYEKRKNNQYQVTEKIYSARKIQIWRREEIIDEDTQIK